MYHIYRTMPYVHITCQEGVNCAAFNFLPRRVSGGGKLEQLPITGGEPDCPAISRSGDRLAYQQNVSFQFDIWRLPLSGGVASGPPSRFIPSTRHESAPEYSDADGTHVVELFSEAGVVSGAHAGRLMGSVSPSFLMPRGTTMSVSFGPVGESPSV